MEKLQLVAELIGYIALVATVIVRVTPSQSDNAILNKVLVILNKVFKALPTLGINPKVELPQAEITPKSELEK